MMNNRSRFKWLIVIAIIVIGVAGYLAIAKPNIIKGGSSGLIEIKPLEELVKESNLIVIGEIIEGKSSQPYFVNDDPNYVMIMHTEYTLRVERYLLSSKDIGNSNTVTKY